MAILNLYSLVQHHVRAGNQFTSLQRAVQRENVKARALGLSETSTDLRTQWVKATEEFANEALLGAQPKSFEPRLDFGRIPSSFKEPWRFRDVVQVNFIDPATGLPGSTNISINYNQSQNLGASEQAGFGFAQAMARDGGGSDIPEGAEIESVEVINSYENV